MLVLSRRLSESIVIGQDIVVTVLEVHRDQVRIGIEAPRDVDVHRREVFEAIQAANRSAASPSDEALAALGGLVSAKARGAAAPEPADAGEPPQGPADGGGAETGTAATP